MNKVLVKLFTKRFLINFLIITAGFYCFGVILNLLEEIEFSKIKCKLYGSSHVN